jgi:large subunit ribosomal protein L13
MTTTQKTYSPKASEITRPWRLVDAQGKTLGRLASEVAGYLRGKHIPIFSEHMDSGDFVVVVNATRIRLTGNKALQRKFYRHSGYPGGFKSVALGDLFERHPDRVVKHAVKGMLPRTTLGAGMLRKLKVYGGPTHPHAGQLHEGVAPRKQKAAAPTAQTKTATSDTEEITA